MLTLLPNALRLGEARHERAPPSAWRCFPAAPLGQRQASFQGNGFGSVAQMFSCLRAAAAGTPAIRFVTMSGCEEEGHVRGLDLDPPWRRGVRLGIDRLNLLRDKKPRANRLQLPGFDSSMTFGASRHEIARRATSRPTYNSIVVAAIRIRNLHRAEETTRPRCCFYWTKGTHLDFFNTLRH